MPRRIHQKSIMINNNQVNVLKVENFLAFSLFSLIDDVTTK